MLYGTNSKILLRLSELIDIGGDFELANNLLQNNMSYGERIARIKGARRLSYYTHDQKLIVISKVGAFEASVARSLINMGADVVLVLGIKNNEMRGSGRTNIKNLNIGNIMKIIGDKFGGTGGGHAAAAGLNIVPLPEKKLLKKIEEEFINLVKEDLNN